MGEHLRLEAPQFLARLEPELIGEQPPRLAIDRERLGLAAAAIQREHEVPVETLAPRVPARELLELAHELGVPAGREVGLDARLERRQPLLLQALDLGRRERQ